MMKRHIAAALATIFLVSGCAELTTTGLPQKGNAIFEGSEQLVEANKLDQTSWTLVEAEFDSADLAALGVTAEFEADGVAGKAPVNRYFGSYTLTGESGIKIGPLGSTKMAGPPAAMRAETAYLALLEEVTDFDIEGNELTMLKNDQKVLVFHEVDPETAAAQRHATTLIGVTADQAKSSASTAGFDYRVLSVDGEHKMATADYNPRRINVEIQKGTVQSAWVG